MELSQLEAFQKVAARHSFSAAALELHLTQPSVSARIQALERELNVVLFERGGRGAQLTDAGRALLPYADAILAAAAEGREVVSGIRTATGGHLTLASAHNYSIPRLIGRFRAAYPGVEVSIHTGSSQQVVELVAQDEAHCGLARSPITHPQIWAAPLYEDEVVLVAHPQHAFAGRGEISLAELGRAGLVLYTRDTGLRTLLDRRFSELGFEPKVLMEIDNVETSKQVVLQGVGLSMLPRETVQGDLDAGRLSAIGVRGFPTITRTTCLVLRRGRHLSPALRAFLAVVAESYSLTLSDLLPPPLPPDQKRQA
ncbi:MAG: LysR family transcriptional regulator [Chloroflexota bacterium]